MAGKKADKKANEVVTKDQFTRADVPKLLAEVNRQIAELKGEEQDPITDGNLENFGRLSDINDVTTLVRAASSVKGKAAAYNNVAEELQVDLSKFPFKINKWGAEKWMKDIKRRINEVTYKDKLNKLEKVRDELSGFLSEDDKFSQAVHNIVSIMKD